MSVILRNFTLIVVLLIILDILTIMSLSVWLLVIGTIVQVAGSIYIFITKRKQEYRLLFFLETELLKKEPIVKELWDDTIQLVGWVLLFIPGFFTGFVGILFLNKDVRSWLLSYFFYDAL